MCSCAASARIEIRPSCCSAARMRRSSSSIAAICPVGAREADGGKSMHPNSSAARSYLSRPPSLRGQEACQIGAVLALRGQDWLFPTYRDSVAVLQRGVDAAQALSLLRGDWHCGYDPYQRRVAPQCTPLATNTLHAVGLAIAAT